MEPKHIKPSAKDNHEYAFLQDEIVSRSTTKWENIIFCYIYGVWPTYYQFKSYAQRVWRVEKNYKLEVHGSGLFLLHLPTSNIVTNIMNNGPYDALLLKKWTPNKCLCR